MVEKRICQCCGMPLENEVVSRNPDGTINEDYCKYCYSDGKFNKTFLIFCTPVLISN